ncbi:isoleucyl-tRNA synthetase [Pedobacter frigoris]|uniref:Isoleucyl-tRNA synthetase n=1 Tax=Pedobacter frigoris TaxID=2571272 RepID=A0A4U1CIX8_9SPHI|nr:isoleucyl-tRNA synthetase [Pedobacter frigoris]TKC07387.1 isoleucyl-tRNA synthetase [Pedobacter frigoris]
MIKILKLQKAVIAFILGILALIGYKVMSVNKIESSNYLLSLAGILFITGALMFLFPIIFAKQNKQGEVELDPEKQEEELLENEKKVATEESPL